MFDFPALFISLSSVTIVSQKYLWMKLLVTKKYDCNFKLVNCFENITE